MSTENPIGSSQESSASDSSEAVGLSEAQIAQIYSHLNVPAGASPSEFMAAYDKAATFSQDADGASIDDVLGNEFGLSPSKYDAFMAKMKQDAEAEIESGFKKAA